MSGNNSTRSVGDAGCPRCGFAYKWNGKQCGHCNYPQSRPTKPGSKGMPRNSGDSVDPDGVLLREFKRSAAACHQMLLNRRPAESPYAVLFEIGDQSAWACAIGATEESLAWRVAAEMKSSKEQLTDSQHAVLMRWEAPGDTAEWYWLDENPALIAALEEIPDYEHNAAVYQAVQEVCLNAFRELDDEGTFGRGAERERLVIGVSNVDRDFRDFLPLLAKVNPPGVISRLEEQFREVDALVKELFG